MNLRTIERQGFLANPYVRFSAILAAGFILRIFLSLVITYRPDFSAWIAWGNQISTVGFGKFYEKYWCDYMPGYLYVLWVLDNVHSALPGLPIDILFKLPANLSDLGISIVIFFSLKLITNPKNAMIASLVYFFNPASLSNSTFWGQIDSVNAFPILLSVYLGLREKFVLSGVFAALAFMIKPQSIVIFPLIGFLALLPVIRNRKTFDIRSLLPPAKLAITIVITSAIVTLPFIWDKIDSFSYLFVGPIDLIRERFNQAYEQYKFTSLNAFNFWGATALWESDEIKILGISYKTIGTIIFGTAYAAIMGLLVRFAIFARNNNSGEFDYTVFEAITLILFTLFLFVTRAHERHLLPTIVFFTLITFRIWIFWYFYAIVSGIYVLNMIYSFIQLTNSYQGIDMKYTVYFIPGLFILYLTAYIVIFFNFVIATVNFKHSYDTNLSRTS
jgi:dolichyl-phosphate-mannose-protein mannosyltransferase